MATIAGVTCNIVNDSIRPEWLPGIRWRKLSSGAWLPFDEGAPQDKYATNFDIVGTRVTMEAVITGLNSSGRELVTVSFGSGEPVFGPSAYATTQVIIDKYPELVREGYNYWTLRGLRAISVGGGYPTGTPSLSGIRLAANRYAGNVGFSSTFAQSMVNSFNTFDNDKDEGTFRAQFIATDSQYSQIRAYIVQNRGAVISFPSIQGITYPFGPKIGSSGGSCRIVSLSNERRVKLDWLYELTMKAEV